MIFFFFIFGILFFSFSDFVLAQQKLDVGLQFAKDTGLVNTDIRVIVARIIRISFGVLGILAVSIILYGGFLWMTSQGEQGKIDSAKKVLLNATIGLAIILSAFGITEFIIRTILGQDGNSSNSPFSSNHSANNSWFGFGGGALGRSIRAHYPDRDAVDVYRNTKVIITFAEKINDATIFDITKKNQPNINTSNVKIYKFADAKTGGLPPADSLLIKDVTVTTNDSLNYVFSFANYLGSPSEKVQYVVYLDKGIQKENKQSIFGGLSDSYAWRFTTGTTIDLIPPYVESVTPVNSGNCPSDIATCAPRNEIIQINFNEPIDPTTVTGNIPLFTFIKMNPQVSGEFLLGNQYKTVVFVPKDGCDQYKSNSCGDPIFCLPGKVIIEVTLKTAELDTKQQGTSQALLPYTGIVDVAGNALDGQGGLKRRQPEVPNGKAEGSPKDDYVWEFNTSDNIDLIPPKIVSIIPDINQSKVKLDEDLKIEFSKPIDMRSLWGGISFSYALSTTPNQKTEWNEANVTFFGKDIKNNTDSKIVIWKHYTPLYGSTTQKTYYYYPTILSTVKDTRQNCFKPSEGPDATKAKGMYCKDSGNNSWTSQRVGTYPDCDLSPDK